MCDIDIIVPVPLHPARQRKRGYNQSDYIAYGLSASTGVPVKKNIIRRSDQTGSQTKQRQVRKMGEC